MASLDSIGPCSLALDSSHFGPTNSSPLSNMVLAPEPEEPPYVLKSPALLSSLNHASSSKFRAPEVRIEAHDETDRATVKEERFRSYASIYISPEKSVNLSSAKGDENNSVDDNHLPSYLGISCAISGYSGYSRFCHSRENSPARVSGISPSKVSMMSSRSSQGFENSLNTDEAQASRRISESYICNKYFSSSSKDSLGNKLEVQRSYVSSQEITLRGTAKRDFTKSPVQYTNGFHDLGSNKLSNGVCKSSETSFRVKDLPSLDSSQKSLVQQRIESLFGPSISSVQSVQRMSRSKIRTPIDASIAKRSPSCPPESFRASSRSPPVFRHITKDFKEQLRNSPVPTKASFTKTPLTIHSPALTIIPNAKFKLQKPVRNGLSPEPITPSPDENNHLKADTSSHLFQSLPQSPVLSQSVEIKTQKILNGGEAFLDKMDLETEKIKAKILMAEEDLQLPSLPDEASGKLRSAIGKANLLLGQKFKQFRELCLKNINPDPSEPFPTTEGDLAGFWDMVLIQVENVNKVLDDMRQLKEKGWKEDTVPYVKSINQGKPRGGRLSKSSPTTPERSPTGKNSELAKAREEQRKKLMAAKKKGRLQKTSDSEIAIFVPENPK